MNRGKQRLPLLNIQNTNKVKEGKTSKLNNKITDQNSNCHII